MHTLAHRNTLPYRLLLISALAALLAATVPQLALADGEIGATLDRVTLPGAVLLDPAHRATVPTLVAYPAPAGVVALGGDGFAAGDVAIVVRAVGTDGSTDGSTDGDYQRSWALRSDDGSYYLAMSGLPAGVYLASASGTAGSADVVLVVG